MSCEYCGDRDVQWDHLITKNQARRRHAAAAARNDPRFKVRACRNCNEGKGCRLLVPVECAHLIPELEAITMGVYRTWDGTAEPLRETVTR